MLNRSLALLVLVAGAVTGCFHRPYYYRRPVYVAPQPVYVQPAPQPVYVQPPAAQVVVQPAY